MKLRFFRKKRPELDVSIKILRHDAVVPSYKTDGAAGFDFVALDEVTIQPGATVLIGTGLAMAIPEGYELQIRPRSGEALKTELSVKNSPGTIDSDYRGEIKIMLKNNALYAPVVIERGRRIAQGVIAPVMRASFTITGELPETGRGAGGFGSTGAKEWCR